VPIVLPFLYCIARTGSGKQHDAEKRKKKEGEREEEGFFLLSSSRLLLSSTSARGSVCVGVSRGERKKKRKRKRGEERKVRAASTQIPVF